MFLICTLKKTTDFSMGFVALLYNLQYISSKAVRQMDQIIQQFRCICMPLTTCLMLLFRITYFILFLFRC